MEKQNLKPNEIILCTVDRIIGTTVFVKIEGNGEGTLSVNEISPGRIRNLRDYVVPQKKIVCKILSIEDNHANLSLRRVTAKEKKEVMEEYQKEKNAETTLKIVLKEKAQKIIEEIKPVSQFLKNARENPKLLEKLMSKQEAEKLIKILKERKAKQIQVKKNFKLTCNEPNATNLIKKVLAISDKDTKINYIAASKFSLIVKNTDFKEANTKLNTLLEQIEKRCKENKCDLELEK